MSDIKTTAREMFDKMHTWYINNQIILDPERDEVFEKYTSKLIDQIIDLAIAEERKRVVEMIKERQNIYLDVESNETFVELENIIYLLTNTKK